MMATCSLPSPEMFNDSDVHLGWSCSWAIDAEILPWSPRSCAAREPELAVVPVWCSTGVGASWGYYTPAQLVEGEPRWHDDHKMCDPRV